jgi:5,10-methylene-tetrahydrofolate dehydrogenase/methenyl tetrahydrofolate cyclohydrolase
MLRLDPDPYDGVEGVSPKSRPSILQSSANALLNTTPAAVIQRVQTAVIAQHAVVVVGLSGNPFVGKARKALAAAAWRTSTSNLAAISRNGACAMP